MWSGRPEDAGHRSGVLRAMRAQSMEFSELNVEYGSCHQSAAVVPDGSTAPAPADGDYHGPRCAWLRHRQIVSDGAVLVRPDRFIAWRHPGAASDPGAVLTAALSQILGRRPFAQPGSAGS